MEKPCITIIRMYETFGGSGKSAYRTDIRKGKIPYVEMEKLYAQAPSVPPDLLPPLLPWRICPVR